MEIAEVRQVNQSRKAAIEKKMQEERAASEARETKLRKTETQKEQEPEEAVDDTKNKRE